MQHISADSEEEVNFDETGINIGIVVKTVMKTVVINAIRIEQY